jgi:hypothetical protein
VTKSVDATKSLNSLLGWKKQMSPQPTPLAERVAAACDLPLKDLKWPDIRLLIGQDIGLEYLMPWAIDALAKRPLYSAELYEGDLLCACLRVDRGYWVKNISQWQKLNEILQSLDSAMKSVNEAREGFEHEVFQP